MKTLINVGGWQECYGAEWGSEGSERGKTEEGGSTFAKVHTCIRGPR